MDCPKCGSNFTRSKNRKVFSHPVLGNGIRRTLRCDTCDHKFVTVELMNEIIDVLVVDHVGQLTELKRKLLEGVATITTIEQRRAIAASVAAEN